jgi:hypothetical protein
LLPGSAAADSPPTTAAFTASDFAWTAGGGGTTVTIAQGGTVTFSYPMGISEHNADFTTGNPSSCMQTAGPSSGSVPPLPHMPTGQGWSGTCTFATPGTYKFHCDVHPFMIGTVAVQAGGTSPTSSPLAGTPGQAIHVKARQRGSTVRGSIKVSSAGEGGSLQAAVLARASDLGRKGSKQVTVGRSGSKLQAGTVKLSVSLSQSAKGALARRGQLKVQVQLVVRSPGGQTVKATRAVTLLR